MLASDSTTLSPQALVSLISLLPNKPSVDEGIWNLELLTDEQFKTLDHLCAIARREKPPSVEKKRRRPLRSDREVWAALYAHDVDQIEAEHEAAFREKRPFVLSDHDLALLMNACDLWFSPMATAEKVFAHVAENATYSERKLWLDKEAAAETAIARVKDVLGPSPEAKPEPPSPNNNVVEAPFGVFRVRRQSPFEEGRW